MTVKKNNRISKDNNTFVSSPSTSSSSSSSTTRESTRSQQQPSMGKNVKKMGRYETLTIKVSSEWEPLLKHVISSYCPLSETIGKPFTVLCSLSLYSTTSEDDKDSGENSSFLFMNRRFKSKIYAPGAKKCWFFVVLNDASELVESSESSSSDQNVDLLTCSSDKTTKNYFVQDVLIAHGTTASCKIGWVVQSDNDLYIHVITGLDPILGIVENTGKIREGYKFEREFEPKTDTVICKKHLSSHGIFPIMDSANAQALTGMDINGLKIKSAIEELAILYWKETASLAKVKQFEEGIEELVVRINEKQKEQDEQMANYETDEE